MNNTVGRFAPTPSGRMHLGNVFCALLSWLSAKSKGGSIVLRIEDLDTQRAPRHFADLLKQDFRWLGLFWEEGGSTGGPNGSYYQSERTEIYLEYYDRLEKMGLIYPCFCSRAELHSAEAPHMSDGRFLYTGRCRNLSEEQCKELRRTRKPAARVLVPEKTIFFDDLHYGPQKEDLHIECGDFVIRRGDGVFAYQLATAIDDALMGVTEVIRGNDLLSSSPRQIWLQQTLGLPSPEYGHIPLLTAPDGRRLSKRDGDLDLGALQQRFAGPEPIIGMLGYLAGLIDRPEPVKAEELIGLFSWDKVPKEDISMTAEMLDELQR